MKCSNKLSHDVKKIFLKNTIILATILLFSSFICTKSWAIVKEYFLGDINIDNKIDISDQLALSRHLYSVQTGTHKEWQLKGDSLINANISEDTSIDNSDLLSLKRYLASQKSKNVANSHNDWTSICKKVSTEIKDITDNKNNSSNAGNSSNTNNSDNSNNANSSNNPNNSDNSNNNNNNNSNNSNFVLNTTNMTLDLTTHKSEKLSISGNTTNLTVYSSDDKIATISSDGTITGLANGNTIITIQSQSGQTAYCNVTVQTSPSSIYFEANAKEIVKKGDSASIKAIIEPNTANVNTNISYKIASGNSRVATIDNSGKITATQAGLVTIRATTSNGKTANINLLVKIGNKKFDTKELSNSKNSNQNLLYTQKIDLGNTVYGKNSKEYHGSHLQSIAIANSKVYYAHHNTYPKQESYISYAANKPKTNTPTKYMKITYAGHQSSMDIETNGKNTFLWTDGITTKKDKSYGYSSNICISRVPYKARTSYKYAAGNVVEKNSSGKLLKTYNTTGDNFIYQYFDKNDNRKFLTNIHPSIDERNGLLAIYKGTKIYIYDLNEALSLPNIRYTNISVPTNDGQRKLDFDAKNINTLTPLSTIDYTEASKANKVLQYAMQGFDLDGDYIYLAEGFIHSGDEKTYNEAFVNVFDYAYSLNSNITRNSVVAIKSKTFKGLIGSSKNKNVEIEGIKVDTSGSIPTMYLGFVSKNSTAHQYANIFKYTSK